MPVSQLILVAHNLRSSHNVGSLLRTADGLGVSQVYLTGYTPHPGFAGDSRLPHEQAATLQKISKTALGAEKTVNWQYQTDNMAVLQELSQAGYRLAALEQSPDSLRLSDYRPPSKLALIVGNEVTGLEASILHACDEIIEIPMSGKKESFNVVQATAMALYHVTWVQ